MLPGRVRAAGPTVLLPRSRRAASRRSSASRARWAAASRSRSSLAARRSDLRPAVRVGLLSELTPKPANSHAQAPGTSSKKNMEINEAAEAAAGPPTCYTGTRGNGLQRRCDEPAAIVFLPASRSILYALRFVCRGWTGGGCQQRHHTVVGSEGAVVQTRQRGDTPTKGDIILSPPNARCIKLPLPDRFHGSAAFHERGRKRHRSKAATA